MVIVTFLVDSNEILNNNRGILNCVTYCQLTLNFCFKFAWVDERKWICSLNRLGISDMYLCDFVDFSGREVVIIE
jgi:hypothetical protein